MLLEPFEFGLEEREKDELDEGRDLGGEDEAGAVTGQDVDEGVVRVMRWKSSEGVARAWRGRGGEEGERSARPEASQEGEGEKQSNSRLQILPIDINM